MSEWQTWGRIGSIALKLMLLIQDKVVDVEDAANAAPSCSRRRSIRLIGCARP
jgi:hypothetical protein